jgi:tripartite-type tricarboxylate transporter receptor subunit TctC
MIESGVPDYVVLTFIGVVAPAGTPPAIVDKLNAAINQSLRAPEVVAAAARISAELQPGSPADFGAFLARERAKWTEVVQRAGVKFN